MTWDMLPPRRPRPFGVLAVTTTVSRELTMCPQPVPSPHRRTPCYGCGTLLHDQHIVGIEKHADGTGAGYLCGTCFYRREERLDERKSA